MISNYLFALSMGLLAIIMVYLNSLQQQKKVNKITYIKSFIGSTLISLITSEFYKNYNFISNNSGNNIMKGGGSIPIPPITRQEILTGTPNF